MANRRQAAVGMTAGTSGRVVVPARCHQGQPGSGIRVPGQAAVRGGGADGDDTRYPSRVGDLACLVVPGGADEEDSMALGEADRVDEVRDITWADADPELEAQVDDLGTVVDGVADSAGDCCGVAGATGPKNPQRHDRRAVGEAGQREAVVGCLCDLAGD